MLQSHIFKKVQIGNDQEKAQTDLKTHPKNRGGKGGSSQQMFKWIQDLYLSEKC